MAGGCYRPCAQGTDSEPGTNRSSLESKEGKQTGMIEFFKEPNIDWMGKAKYFYALSAILLLAGWISIFAKGGMYYGIDFKGGTNVDVRFAQPPNIDQLRSALTAQGLGNSEIQSIGTVGQGKSCE